VGGPRGTLLTENRKYDQKWTSVGEKDLKRVKENCGWGQGIEDLTEAQNIAYAKGGDGHWSRILPF